MQAPRARTASGAGPLAGLPRARSVVPRLPSRQGAPGRGAGCRRGRLAGEHRCGAASTGAGGFDGGAGGLGGSGGGGGGDGLDGAGSGPSGRGGFWAGWEARVAADPQFIYKVLVEQIIGVGAAVAGDMSSRPYWGLYELDFVFSTLIVGSILNFSLMYLLAPTAGAAAASSSGALSKIVSGETLRALGAPGGHMFEAGFPLSARLTNLVFKGAIFAVVGMAAGLVGTAMSNGLIAVRKALDPAFVPQNELPNVPLNAACWATHMGLSSNLRYQLLNGLEMALQPRMAPGAFRALSSLVRTGNNLAGGVSFVTIAKMMGVQSSAGDEVKQERRAQAAA